MGRFVSVADFFSPPPLPPPFCPLSGLLILLPFPLLHPLIPSLPLPPPTSPVFLLLLLLLSPPFLLLPLPLPSLPSPPPLPPPPPILLFLFTPTPPPPEPLLRQGPSRQGSGLRWHQVDGDGPPPGRRQQRQCFHRQGGVPLRQVSVVTAASSHNRKHNSEPPLTSTRLPPTGEPIGK